MSQRDGHKAPYVLTQDPDRCAADGDGALRQDLSRRQQLACRTREGCEVCCRPFGHQARWSLEILAFRYFQQAATFGIHWGVSVEMKNVASLSRILS